MAAEAPPVRLRQITENDQEGVLKLLREGFPRRSASYWDSAWAKLVNLKKPEGLSQLGYVIDVGGELEGVILVIAAQSLAGLGSKKRANLSSWYVRPKYRSFATMLLSRACKDKDVTFLNVSAAEHTYSICEALGFVRYSEGQIAAMPVLSKRHAGLHLKPFTGEATGLTEMERQVLRDHQAFGCICLVGTENGAAQPLIFVKRQIKGAIPAAQLIYCRSIDQFLRYAKPVGSYLARRGMFFVILDSSGPIDGLKGKYYAGKSPKYYKGPEPPRQGDLAYTEIALFGI